MELIDTALKKKREAIALYGYLVDGASLDSLKRLFAALLDDERKHLERIVSFKRQVETELDGESSNKVVSMLFSQIVNDSGVESLARDEVNFYREVMEYEKNAVDEYESLLEHISDYVMKESMHRMVSHKRQHFEILKDLCVFISKQQSAR